jgi:hypothetical protein
MVLREFCTCDLILVFALKFGERMRLIYLSR